MTTGRHRADRPAGYWEWIDASVAAAPPPSAENIRRARELLAEYAIRAHEEIALANAKAAAES